MRGDYYQVSYYRPVHYIHVNVCVCAIRYLVRSWYTHFMADFSSSTTCIIFILFILILILHTVTLYYYSIPGILFTTHTYTNNIYFIM